MYFDNTTGDRIGRIRYLQYRGTCNIKVLSYYYYYFWIDNGTDISKQQFGYIPSDVFVFVNGSNIDSVFPSKQLHTVNPLFVVRLFSKKWYCMKYEIIYLK